MKNHVKMDNLFDFLEPEEERIKRRESDTNVGNVVTASHGTNIVKESNRLIYSCYTLTEIEQKLMYCFIRHIQWDDTIRRYTVTVQEIKEVCGLSDSRLYNVIAQAADKLLSRVVTIRSHEKNAWVKINWLSFIKYADGKLTFDEIEAFSVPELNPDKGLLVNIYFVGDLPEYAISYVDQDGTTKKFIITVSGEDGSILMDEC